MVPIALLGLSLLSVALAAPLVREETFANIKNVQSDQFVVFYRSSDANSVDILSNVKKAAKVNLVLVLLALVWRLRAAGNYRLCCY